jgi:hypothetical protein
MTIQTTKVKNGRITLPKKLWKKWKGVEVITQTSDDTIVIKKIENPAFWKTWERMGKVSKGILKKDIEKAIPYARKSRKQ